MAAAPKRIRRTPDDARRVILDAAEAVIARTGPGGLRLQEVAEAAGVSHPTILHHFESRDGLMRALNLRTLDQLSESLRAQMETPGAGGAVAAAFAAYRGGLAQRMVWMMQSAEAAPGLIEGPRVFDEMVDRLHALRCRLAAPDRQPDIEDSRAIVHLTTVAALGDALLGSRLRRASSETDEIAARSTFESWVAALIGEHIGASAAG